MKRFAALAILGILLLPLPLAAADTTCDPGILPPCTCDGNCQLTDFVQLFINLYAFGVHLAAPLAIFFIIVGGVILVTASGYSNRIEMGKTMITQAVTGLIIVLISWVIIDTTIFLLTGNKDHTVFGKKWFTTTLQYTCSDERLYQGCSGSNVRVVQQQLVSLGYSVTVDSSYGPQTAAAVRQFQTDTARNVYVTNARLACRAQPDGVLVWNVAFDQSCVLPDGGVCGVSEEEVTRRRLEESGAVDEKTKDALERFSLNVPDEFSTLCRD
ncbi:MAG: peptidoglycan-binding protein [Candidatus Kerfeldbacteria bacterium]|nr:peptidoglycan-binding protein [Candidatus Kerfeldbacteria bacterium]